MDGVPRPNPYAAKCATRLVLDRIADKWTVLVMGLLDGGPVRFNQLRREVEGLSQKVLSQTLRRMERDGLITRTAYPTVPVTVEYALTPLGRTLASTVAPLRAWAENHIQEVLRAQRAYDTRPDRARTEQKAANSPARGEASDPPRTGHAFRERALPLLPQRNSSRAARS